MGSRARKARVSSVVTSFCPSGLAMSEAILATNFTPAIPAEAASRVFSRMCRRNWRAMSAALPNSARESVTSRKASSSDSGSINGVTVSRMANTSSLAWA
jgi:hypothetical protein